MALGIILNETELREARGRAVKLDDALSSEETLRRVAEGLSPEIVDQLGRMMKSERAELNEAIAAYEAAKETGEPATLQARAGGDPGLTLIVARIAKGFSQRDLAWRLGVKEQQVQRYEADRYGSISMKNYSRVAALLGVRLSANIQPLPQFRGLDAVIDDVSKEQIKKILKHGRENGWFSGEMDEVGLRQFIAQNRIQFGSPSLLRTGLNVKDHSDDVLLHAWRARVASRARQVISKGVERFDPIQTGWLQELRKLSVHSDGPRQARDLLLKRGIVMIVEAQIQGLAIDGAAFLEDDVPVIGITLRRDYIDNFWFTLLHEVGHVTLHYRTGLSEGFYDQFEQQSVDEQEAEADSFASNLLISDKLWQRSPARIAKSPAVIEKFAKDMSIHPAIVFGRIRKERNDYTLFSQKIGGKTVRQLFAEKPNEESRDAALSPGTEI